MDFFAFVDLMRHEELINVNGLLMLSQSLQRSPFSTTDSTSTESRDGGGSGDEDLADILNTFTIDIMERIEGS